MQEKNNSYINSKYKDGGFMEESVFNITLKMRNHK